MKYRLAALTAALCLSGFAQAADYPTNEVIAQASVGAFLTYSPQAYSIGDAPYESRHQFTLQPGQTAAVLGDGVVVSARTDYGHNRAFVRIDRDDSDAVLRNSRSAWYEQVLITGGTGTGTATFNVRLRGVIDAGRDAGSLGYTLMASATHPRDYQNVIGSDPNGEWWPNATASTPIVEYRIMTSPYEDTSRIAGLYEPSSPPPSTVWDSSNQIQGIPSFTNEPGAAPLDGPGGGLQFDPPDPDLILAPGAGQVIDLVLSGTFTFTYGEAFYLVGEFGASILSGLGGFEPFGCAPDDAACADNTPDIDIPTMLDFGNGAFLSSILLPNGAVASFASGTPYSVATAPVPEPGEWALMLAGLGLVGWRARRRL